jgi:hypothetical protein
MCEDIGALHDRPRPARGDLIFWDNTWDRNRDGVWNDPLTHVGMVTDVTADDTIEFVHFHYRRGVVTARMNLRHRNSTHITTGGQMVLINSPMRMSGSGTPDNQRWLAGQLYRAFGSAYLTSTDQVAAH